MADDDDLPPGDGTPPPASGPQDPSDIKPISIVDEMKRSYLDYAMSVIVSRALPDARDGLKPVHRRILFSMSETNCTPDRPYTKCARIVGDVMGKYHPHGNLAIYEALVRMAQPFAMRLPLIDGQGNFGSVDGDPPAAERYTESRLEKAAMPLLDDLDKNTVDFVPNYDGRESEPKVLPAKFPNLLVNGAGGIAVGMATNIPPHNLGDVIDACIAYMDDPSISMDALIDIVQGPDFPTGGFILGRAGIRSAYETGRGSVIMRAKTETETIRDREAIIVNEIPYQVNKVTLIEKISDLVKEKRIEGIAALRDESDRDGMRIVIELKREAMVDVVLNQLYRFTSMQTSFPANMVALNGGRPETMALRDLIRVFVEFREEVVSRRTKFLLNKARDRAHVLCGLAIAVANIDEVIRLIRTAPDPNTARESLMARDWPAADIAPLIALVDDPKHRINAEDDTYRLSDIQARAILELRLARLTALGRDEVGDELQKLASEISDYLYILRSRARIQAIIKDELTAIRDQFATPRKTQILDWASDVDDEDLIQREDMVITVSHAGYIKRVPLSTYRAQRRGGKGRSGMQTRDEDFVTRLFVANTHTPILFFSSRGQAYKEKVWRLPLAAPTARGKALVNMLPLQAGERITTIMPLPEDEASWDKLDVMFATDSGNVRRNKLSDFVQVNRNGKIAMKLDEGDHIVGVETCSDTGGPTGQGDDVLLTTSDGQCVRFPIGEVRVFKGRDSTGVRGITLAKDDRVISMSILHHYEATPEERVTYLKDSMAERRARGDEPLDDTAALPDSAEEGAIGDVELGAKRNEMRLAEQFVLTLSENGFGKRTSSFGYRTTRRGGKGIVAMATTDRNGRLVASFPVAELDQIMLVTNGGQLIRVPVHDIRIAGRATQGVTVFSTGNGEKVVSVEHLEGEENGDADDVPGVDEPSA